jgi:pimeloyl-ACP methyl ester carboxylesterase
MTETTPDQILARAQVPTANGRPVRKDEIELTERGIYIESWLPERRSRRKPLLFVHGELGGSWLWERFLGYFAGRGWEGHALNLRNHHWSQTADSAELSFESFVDDVGAALDHLGPNVVAVGHGMGGLLVLKSAERRPISGLVLIASELPGDVRDPTAPHLIREVPELFGPSLLGWATLPEKLQRDHRDLTLADVLRIQHLMGQKPHESGRARRTMLRGVRVDPSRLAEVPRLVIGGGFDRVVSVEASEHLATWLDAEFEPFGAHSHYGLILGEEGYGQVADSIRSFLEAHRL